MKRFLIGLIGLCYAGVSWAGPLPDNMYFRAMHDEMQRSLANLHLKDHPRPYYMYYLVREVHSVVVKANMGTLAPALYDENELGSLSAEVFVSVGSDKQDGLGFSDVQRNSWEYLSTQIPYGFPSPGYDGLRQTLWQLTDKAYLQAADLYKKKKVYKQKKNIHDTLPDVVPEKPGYFVEPIPPFAWPDIAQLQKQVREISALGKTQPFVESFDVELEVRQQDFYYLNSRGAVAQYTKPHARAEVSVVFRQPDGKTAKSSTVIWLKDVSAAQLDYARNKAQDFLNRVRQAYGAPSATAYIGPVLLKPQAAARMIKQAVLNDLENSKPWLLSYADDDDEAGKLYKKQHVRVSTDLLTLYDRPLARQFEGITLLKFAPLDKEGVAAQNLTLIQNGRVQDFPLTQRPLTKNHHSNGHAYLDTVNGPREGLTNVFVEPKEQLTDEQMEEKLLARCRELGLEYGYILYGADPSGDLGLERIYTSDGRKETVLNLKWDGNFFTQRDLRGVLAVGGERQLSYNWRGPVVVTPSVLMEEVELVPQEHKAHRQPFIPKPKM
ncbi:MAG: metallopeptidase TldD-related protein [Elusimicrobiaceae bacterium]|nr:metallopeptidase TldD-related protein [Elusimicrobiaceae bacterium]